MAQEYTKEEKAAWLAAQPKKVLSSKVLLFDTAGRVLVVKPSYKKNWDIPGGIVDQGESPLEAATREVTEELQLMLLPRAMQFAGVRYGIATESQGDFVHFIF